VGFDSCEQVVEVGAGEGPLERLGDPPVVLAKQSRRWAAERLRRQQTEYPKYTAYASGPSSRVMYRTPHQICSPDTEHSRPST
jgi:hypothetical protein